MELQDAFRCVIDWMEDMHEHHRSGELAFVINYLEKELDKLERHVVE